MTNTKKLKSKMIENGFSIKTLSKEMKISPATLSQKLNNKIKFSQPDIRCIYEILELSSNDVVEIFLS